MSFLWKVVVVLIAIVSLYFVFSSYQNSSLYQNCVKGLLSEGPTSIEDQSQGKGNSAEEIQNSECLKINDEDSTLNKSLKVIASYLLDIKSNTATMFGSEDFGLTKPNVNNMMRDLELNPDAFNSNEKLLKLMQAYQDEPNMANSPEEAQRMIIDSLKFFIERNMGEILKEGLLHNLDKNKDRIKLYNKGTLGHDIPSPSPHK